jgi:very-short-patch-repair endonuclease
VKSKFNNHYNKELKDYARELRTESVSRAEKLIWKALLARKQTGFQFLRQRPIDNFIVDFFCPNLKLIIEIDGNSHFRKPEYDRYRQDKLISLGYEMLRFKEGEVINQLDHVSVKIDHAVFVLSKKKSATGFPPLKED